MGIMTIMLLPLLMVVMEKMAKFMDHDIIDDPIWRDDDPPAIVDKSSSKIVAGEDIDYRLEQRHTYSASSYSYRSLPQSVDNRMSDQEFPAH